MYCLSPPMAEPPEGEHPRLGGNGGEGRRAWGGVRGFWGEQGGVPAWG